MVDFWQKLHKPFLTLAPMYDVTDAAFRRMFAKYGKPDVLYTEFVSADGLANETGYKRLKSHLVFDKSEHPIVAQIFGAHPENFETVAALLQEMGFDGIDINMGCPDKAVMKQGSCAALFLKPELAKEIILATKKGAPNIPVSCKIRIGDTKIDWKPWISKLLEAKPAEITIHLRTRKEMSKVPAHWEIMPEIVQFIREHSTKDYKPLIVGNGDVQTLEEAKQKIAETGCDGIMIGRGAFGKPYFFNSTSPSQPDTLKILIEHIKLFDELLGKEKNFDIMKKHFKAYTNGLTNAAEIRQKLFTTKQPSEAIAILESYLKD